MTSALGRWDPLPIDDLPVLLDGMDCRWWVAGGWAIDLHLGRVTRPHDDTDVVILREDQSTARHHLATWDLQAADPPGTLRPWPLDEILPVGVHDVWCRRDVHSPWSLQLMLDDVRDGEWVYRREPRVRRSLDRLDGPASRPGLRVLAPEISLLYKSVKPRPKDVADFHAVRGSLDQDARRWLSDALGPDHPWTRFL